MTHSAAIDRRPSGATRFVVTALPADALLETLRELVPDLREARTLDDADEAPAGDAVVITCAAPARTAGDARPSRGTLAVLPEGLGERFGLSGRQAEVARLLAAGHSNGEIAQMLGLSTYTARNHAARVLRKLGIRRRSGVGLAILADGDHGEG